MTDVIGLRDAISRSLNTQIEIESRGIDAFQVFTPFVLGDGDELKIVLKRTGDSWKLTDEGHTLMYLSYHDLGIDSTARAAVMERILKSHFMKDENGRFVLDDIKTPQDIVDAVFTFSQGLLKIGDMFMWKIERAKSRYDEDFKSCITEGVKGRSVKFAYQNEKYDPDGMYLIDCLVTLKTGRPAYIFSATSADKANRTAATIYYFEKKQPYVPSCAVLQGEISGKPLLRLDAAVDKVFQTPQNAVERLDMFLLKYEAA